MSSHTKAKPASPSAREEQTNRSGDKIRHRRNRLPDAQRERPLDEGMQLSYGSVRREVPS